jgi:hypothetical protein
VEHRRFDHLTKSVAARGSRRSALRLLGGSALAAGLARLGLRPAAAAPVGTADYWDTNCRGRCAQCDRDGQCCSGRCQGGVCKCKRRGSCFDDRACCSGRCRHGRCKRAPDPGCDGSGCTPQCEDKECGDDGCGGSCGKCPRVTVCDARTGQCCVPKCQGCGDDGCGGVCVCPSGLTCEFGQCRFCKRYDGWCQSGRDCCEGFACNVRYSQCCGVERTRCKTRSDCCTETHGCAKEPGFEGSCSDPDSRCVCLRK